MKDLFCFMFLHSIIPIIFREIINYEIIFIVQISWESKKKKKIKRKLFKYTFLQSNVAIPL